MASATFHEDFSRICGLRVDTADRAPGWDVLSSSDIVYAFLESELTARNIGAEWTPSVSAEPGVVYLRVAKGVYRTRLTHLTQLTPYLRGFEFAHVNRALIARVDALQTFKLQFRIGFQVRNTTDWLRASQRNFKQLRARFGIKPSDFR